MVFEGKLVWLYADYVQPFFNYLKTIQYVETYIPQDSVPLIRAYPSYILSDILVRLH